MISKKIQKGETSQSEKNYIRMLLKYTTNPGDSEDEEIANKHEKCVAIKTNCLHATDIDGIVDEMYANVETWQTKNQPIVHRIISLQKDERLSEQKFFALCAEYMEDLGYTEAHQYVMVIHNDTEHLHAHIIANRHNIIDGKLLQEGNGWDKNEGRRACARLEKKYGLAPVAGSSFVATDELETYTHINPFTNEKIERQRYKVVQVTKEKKTSPNIRDRARWQELKQGVKSHQRILQEIFEEIRPQLSTKLNFGAMYKLLAEKGVEANLVKHGDNTYLTYSLDGQVWEKASAIHKDFTVEALEKILGSTIRKPRVKTLTDIIAKARQGFQEQVTDDLRIEIPYNDEQIELLKSIKLTDVKQAFDLTAIDGTKIKNAVDYLMHKQKKSYGEALQALAEKFPDVLTRKMYDKNIDEKTLTTRIELANVPDHLKNIGVLCLKQVDAYGAEKFYVYGSGNDLTFSSAEQNPQGWTKQELLQKLPYIAEMNERGCTIYIAPIYDKKIDITFDDVQQAFVNTFKPSFLIKANEKKQSHYIIGKKYNDDFYNVLTEHINYKWGDKNANNLNNEHYLAGFSEEGACVKIDQSNTMCCSDFENYVDEQYRLYTAGELKHIDQAVLPKKEINLYEQEKLMSSVSLKPVSVELTNRAIVYQKYMIKRYGSKNFKKINYMTANMLYMLQATPDQVYTFLSRHGLSGTIENTNQLQNKFKHNIHMFGSENRKDREARHITIHAYYNESHYIAKNNLPDIKQAIPIPVSRWQHEQTQPSPNPIVMIDDRTKLLEQDRRWKKVQIEESAEETPRNTQKSIHQINEDDEEDEYARYKQEKKERMLENRKTAESALEETKNHLNAQQNTQRANEEEDDDYMRMGY